MGTIVESTHAVATSQLMKLPKLPTPKQPNLGIDRPKAQYVSAVHVVALSSE